jgi:hypothetical protein
MMRSVTQPENEVTQVAGPPQLTDAPSQITPEEIVRMFSSRKKGEREEAEQQLQDMGPLAVEALLTVVQEENKKHRKSRKINSYTIMALVGAFVFAILGMVIYGLATGNWHALSDWSTFATMFGGMGGAAVALGGVHKSAAKVLAMVGDVRAVGPLTEMLNVQDKEIRTAAENALTRLLPRISEENSDLLSAEQVQTLCWVMGKRLNPDLGLSILQAMEHVGSEDALPTIRAIANGGRGIAGLEIVQNAAKKCLPLVEARAAREHDAQTLLRASTQADEPSEMLLRPAGGTVGVDQDLLLRPADTV